jgi:membrane protease YdiL (CAAX protease family)
MLRLWRLLPVVVRSIVIGTIVASLGTIPWALMVEANRRWMPMVPWSALPAAGFLWLWWRYMRGTWWPTATGDARRTSARVNTVSGDQWGPALLAGWLGLIGVVLFQQVMNRLIHLPEGQDLRQLGMPTGSLLVLVIMGSIVAGVVEEVAFRGYMQGPIERRHGPVAAILITGLFFGATHFTHREVTWAVMPYIMAAAGVYGTIAYLTNSVVPGMVLHAGGDVFLGLAALATGASEWRGAAAPQPLVWETGIDASFSLSVIAMLFVGALTIMAFISLAGARTRSPVVQTF